VEKLPRTWTKEENLISRNNFYFSGNRQISDFCHLRICQSRLRFWKSSSCTFLHLWATLIFPSKFFSFGFSIPRHLHITAFLSFTKKSGNVKSRKKILKDNFRDWVELWSKAQYFPHKGFDKTVVLQKNHTESQNVRGWKGPLWVI